MNMHVKEYDGPVVLKLLRGGFSTAVFTTFRAPYPRNREPGRESPVPVEEIHALGCSNPVPGKFKVVPERSDTAQRSFFLALAIFNGIPGKLDLVPELFNRAPESFNPAPEKFELVPEIPFPEPGTVLPVFVKSQRAAPVLRTEHPASLAGRGVDTLPERRGTLFPIHSHGQGVHQRTCAPRVMLTNSNTYDPCKQPLIRCACMQQRKTNLHEL